ncbi:hypothetical protein, partial [Pseudomonas viridiflava]|uniref:hypothetical protein n=2 Tax=Pseudomonas viridiflava TaxID=33069 RepID=UPI0019D01672
MNETAIYAIFLACGVAFYLPALCTRYAWSGENFTPTKYWINMIYNIFFAYQHMRVIDKNSLPFYGEQDSSIIILFSLVMVVAHACAHTVTWDIK